MERLQIENEFGLSDELEKTTLHNNKELIGKNISSKEYYKKIDATSRLTEEETLLLFEEIEKAKQKNDEEVILQLKNKLIEANLKLPFFLAKNLKPRIDHFELFDLVQEGNIGLIDAIENYFINKEKYKFSIYAGLSIAKAINRALQNTGKIISIPVHKLEKQNKYFKVLNRLERQLNRDPLVCEIAEEMKISPEDALKIIKISQIETISLDTEIINNKDDNNSDPVLLQDIILDKENLEQKIIDNCFAEYIKENIDFFNEEIISIQDKDITKEYFGINDGILKTQEEIGIDHNITRSRVQQIIKGSKKKFKNSQRFQKIYKDYFGKEYSNNNAK